MKGITAALLVLEWGPWMEATRAPMWIRMETGGQETGVEGATAGVP